MQDKANKTFVCRVNGHSIYWSHREARQNAYRFIIIKYSHQVYDTEDLYGAITYCLEESEWTAEQRERFTNLAEEHDIASVGAFKLK